MTSLLALVTLSTQLCGTIVQLPPELRTQYAQQYGVTEAQKRQIEQECGLAARPYHSPNRKRYR